MNKYNIIKNNSLIRGNEAPKDIRKEARGKKDLIYYTEEELKKLFPQYDKNNPSFNVITRHLEKLEKEKELDEKIEAHKQIMSEKLSPFKRKNKSKSNNPDIDLRKFIKQLYNNNIEWLFWLSQGFDSATTAMKMDLSANHNTIRIRQNKIRKTLGLKTNASLFKVAYDNAEWLLNNIADYSKNPILIAYLDQLYEQGDITNE